MNSRRQAARGDLPALAILVATITLYFLPWITLQKVFFQVDIAFMDHPTRFHAFDMIREGRFPFWTDSLLAGFPLFAEGQAAVLYPFSWLYYFLPPETALNAFIVLHYLILAACSYLFLRSRTLAPYVALFGALSCVFSSFMLVEHVLPNFLSVAAWLPLLLYLSAKYIETGRPRHMLSTALLLAMMHMAGDPLGTLLCVLLMAMFAAFGGEGSPTRDWRRKAAFVVLSVLMGTALAAVQLAPTLEFLRESTRLAGSALTSARFIPPEFLMTACFPNFFGASFAQYTGATRQVWEESLFFYMGWAPLLLIPFSLRRGGTTRFWLIVAILSLLLSSRTTFCMTRHLWTLPILGLFRWPSRIMLWYTLAVAVAASHGLDYVLHSTQVFTAQQYARRFGAAIGMGSGAIALFCFWRGSFLADAASIAPKILLATRDRDAFWLAANWIALLVVVWLGRRQIVKPTLVALVFLASLLLGIMVNQKPEGVSPAAFQNEPEASRFLKDIFGLKSRFLALAPWSYPTYPVHDNALRNHAASLPANLHLRYSLKSIGQFDVESTTTLQRSRAFLAFPSPRILDLLAVEAVTSPPHLDDLFEFLASRWGQSAASARDVLSDDYSLCHSGDALVFCRRQRLSRAFLVDNYEIMDASSIPHYIQSQPLNLRSLVILERKPTWRNATTARESLRDRVDLTVDEPARVELEVETARDKMLVLADNHYPGWKAEIDGRFAEILLADGFVRAVAVPAGRHHVAFRYEPRAFRLGLALSFSSLMLIPCVSYGVIRRRRKTHERPPS